MKKMSKYLALLLALVMVFALVACGGEGEADPTKAPEQTKAPEATKAPEGEKEPQPPVEEDKVYNLRVGVQALPDSFAPWEANATGRKQVLPTVYQPILDCDKPTGTANLVLAKEVEQLEDHIWRITLWDDIYDTAGNHFTASDAVFCITKCKEAAAITPIRNYKYAEVVSDYVLDLYMEDFCFFEYEFANSLGLVWCVTEKAYNESGDNMASNPVGTAGYEVTNINYGSTVTVKKVDDYWAEDKKDSIPEFYHANPDVIEFQMIAEASQQGIALETGTVDCIPILASSEIERFADSDKFTLHTVKDYSPAYIMFNSCDKSPFASKELRQAVAYAIDIEEVIEGAKDGYADPCLTFGCDNMPDVPESWLKDGFDTYYPYDTAKAEELIKASGFDTKQTLQLMVENKGENKTACEIIQGQLAMVGLNVEILMYDTAAYNDIRTQEEGWHFRFHTNGGESVVSFMNNWLGFDTLDTGTNWALVYDEELHALLDEALEKENFQNEEVMTRLKDYVNESLYAYGIWVPYNFAASVKGIDVVGLNEKNYPAPGGTVFNADYVSPEIG